MARRARLLMIQGTSSGSGKSTLVTGLCRMFSDAGYKVAPYKAQNMSSNLYQTEDGSKVARAQAIQAIAARVQPESHMNPVLLRPLGDYRSEVLVNGRFYAEMHAKDYYAKFALQQGLPMALKALDGLRREHDIVVMEGAGSPAEVNIARYDIANMLIAERVKAPVIITTDIERGGCFASIVGTMQLLKAKHRALVKGFLINKFRGDQSLLEPGIVQIRAITKKQVLGIIPKIDFDLPEEDSLTGGPARPDLPQESWDWQIDLLAKAIRESVDISKLEKVAGL
jgi:adenosylcobyric acid synthase